MTRQNAPDIVVGEQPFFRAVDFTIGESATGYTLNSSVDYDWTITRNASGSIVPADNANAHWASCAEYTSASIQHIVGGVPAAGLTFKLVGNSGSVVIR